MVSGYPTSTNFLLVDGLLTDPRDLRCHSLVSELRYTNTLGSLGIGLEHAVKVWS